MEGHSAKVAGPRRKTSIRGWTRRNGTPCDNSLTLTFSAPPRATRMLGRMPLRSLIVRGSTSVWDLCKRHPVAVCVVASLVLCLPAVGPSLFLDDYVLGLIAREKPVLPGLAQGRFDLFAFALGDIEPNRALEAQGLLLPWWSAPDLKVVFFRPLSSLSHHLDFAAWPRAPELMYLHSLLWLGATVAVVAKLYRSFATSKLEGFLASALFAVNDANGAAVHWVSNRNVIIGTLFGALALTAHHRARSAGRTCSVAAVLWVCVGLAAGEIGVWTFAYLSAYVLVLDEGTLKRRAASMVPYALVLFAWQLVYAASDAGSRASGVYLHPWYDFANFLESLPARLLPLLSSVWGLIPADASHLGGSDVIHFSLVAGMLTCLALVVVAHRYLREDRALRFWALGMVLSLVPVSASFPSDRLLMPANLGAMALVARFAMVALRPAMYPNVGRARRIGGLFFVAIHGVLAPLQLPFRANSVHQLTQAMSRSVACLDEIRHIERKTLIFLGGPVDFWISYLQAERTWKGLPTPDAMVWLTSASSALLVDGSDQALSFERDNDIDAIGFFQSPAERLYRDDSTPFERGQRFVLPTLDAVIDEVNPGGSPLRITFRLHEPLASARYALLTWQGDRYVLTPPESLSGEHRIPVAHFVEALFAR